MFIDGNHRLEAICKGNSLTLKYKYAGVTKKYYFWMGEDSDIHVKVKYPDGHEETPDVYHNLECKYALLAGRVISKVQAMNSR